MQPFELSLGTARIHALLDGVLTIDMREIYQKNGQPLSDLGETMDQGLSVNAYLIRDKDQTILIDTGSGALFGPDHGKLSEQLSLLGLTPDHIDHIILTHIHADHSGGLAQEGKATFPHAKLHVGKTEADFWIGGGAEAIEEKTARLQTQIARAHACIDPYKNRGDLVIFEDNNDILPSFHAILRPGHTPGHISIAYENDGQSIIFIGDLVHGTDVQFQKPEITVTFDYDQALAAKTRMTAFAVLASTASLIAAAHLPYPGIGHLLQDNGHFRYAPV